MLLSAFGLAYLGKDFLRYHKNLFEVSKGQSKMPITGELNLLDFLKNWIKTLTNQQGNREILQKIEGIMAFLYRHINYALWVPFLANNITKQLGVKEEPRTGSKKGSVEHDE